MLLKYLGRRRHAQRPRPADSRRFDHVDQRMDRLQNEMRTGFATSAAGRGQIVGLLNHVIARLDDE
jgi:hypothetical protein